MRYTLAQRVCRRDPLPRRLDRICGRGPQLAWGQESAPLERRAADSGKESVRPKGRGCLERGTLKADRQANPKGKPALFISLTSCYEVQTPAQNKKVIQMQPVEERLSQSHSIRRPCSPMIRIATSELSRRRWDPALLRVRFRYVSDSDSDGYSRPLRAAPQRPLGYRAAVARG